MSVSLPSGSFLIIGMSTEGKQFRPSDWAERLCGVMSPFRPGGASPLAHLTYSPYVTPDLHEGSRCVRVDARIREIEPMAYKFLRSFAADNALQVVEL